MKSNENEKIEWENILYFKEIQYYLNNESLFVLRGCCKKLNNLISPSSIYDLYFSSFFKTGELQSFKLKSSLVKVTCKNPFNAPHKNVLNDIKLFDDKLQAINNKYKKLIVKNQVDYLYSYKLVDRFNKITNLHLNNCIITLDLLQYMFNNLKLTQLSIEVVTTIYNKPNSKVTLPQTLVKFKYIMCSSVLAQCNTGPVEIQTGYSQSNTPLFIEPQHIPSLKYFDYDDYDTNPNNFDQLLELNPQLTSIKAFPYNLNEVNLDIIQSNNQLKNLVIQPDYPTPFEASEFPIINSLLSLTVTAFENGESSLNFISYCPNLIKLKLIIDDIQNIYNGMYFAIYLPNLKYLTLESDRLQLFDSFIILPIIEGLEVIEFYKFYPEDVDFKALDNFPKLRVVKFYGGYDEFSKKQFHSEIGVEGEWKITYYYDCIIYNKC